MLSFPTLTSVLSLLGALGCPGFQVGAVPSLPARMGTFGMALGEQILQQLRVRPYRDGGSGLG